MIDGLEDLKKAVKSKTRTRSNVEQLRDAMTGVEPIYRSIESAKGQLEEANQARDTLEAVIGTLAELVDLGVYDAERMSATESAIQLALDTIPEDTEDWESFIEAYEEADSKTETAVDYLEEGYTKDDRDEAYEEALYACEELISHLEMLQR